MSITAYYAGREFVLEDDVDLTQLGADISKAVAEGGGLVWLDLKGGGASVVVSSSIPLALSGSPETGLQRSSFFRRNREVATARADRA